MGDFGKQFGSLLMGDCKPTTPVCDGEHHVIAAAQHIIKVLGTSGNLTDELRKLLVDVDTHLSTMAIIAETSGQQFTEIEARLKHAETKITNVSTGVEEYLQAVDEIRYMTEIIGSLSLSEPGKQKELIHRAHAVLQMGMERLEEELVHILSSRKKSFGCENTSNDLLKDESFVSPEDDCSSGKICDANMYEYIIDLVHPIALPDVKSIANRMFASNYDQEFCEAFISVRKDALDEYLVILEIEELSIEDITKLESSILDHKIKRWSRVMKILVQVYLRSEKWLCKQILGNFGPVHEICFVEISTASVMRLLNFGQAVALGPREPDQLFRLLNLYELLLNLVVDIGSLFSIESGSFVKTEFHELVKRLGDSAKATFGKFENAIALKTSTNPFLGGGIHPLSKYVMNYLILLTDYGNTLNLLFQDGTENPFARHLYSVTSILESNLVSRSMLYKNDALQDVFLMNNIHYMAQKVENSGIRVFIGDEWIITHIGKMQQLARSYERKAWASVLSLLVDDVGSSLNCITKSIVKQRFKRFNLAFEEIYKNQVGWCVPDPRLRSDLQISISTKLIQGYRGFTTRNSRFVKEKYIKYTADDLAVRLLDLFEGPPTRSNFISYATLRVNNLL